MQAGRSEGLRRMRSRRLDSAKRAVSLAYVAAFAKEVPLSKRDMR